MVRPVLVAVRSRDLVLEEAENAELEARAFSKDRARQRRPLRPARVHRHPLSEEVGRADTRRRRKSRRRVERSAAAFLKSSPFRAACLRTTHVDSSGSLCRIRSGPANLCDHGRACDHTWIFPPSGPTNGQFRKQRIASWMMACTK